MDNTIIVGKGHKLPNLTGKKFTRLLLKEKLANGFYLCLCDCGQTIKATGNKLLNGKVQSCGCYKKDLLVKRNTKHGMANCNIYGIWKNIHTRCENNKNVKYNRYGGRGIECCKRWESFKNFYDDMGSTYKHGLSIERIDNNKGYCPENCKWATSVEQARNTSRNHFIQTEQGTITLAEYAEKNNFNYKKLWARINAGWPMELWLVPNNSTYIKRKA